MERGEGGTRNGGRETSSRIANKEGGNRTSSSSDGHSLL